MELTAAMGTSGPTLALLHMARPPASLFNLSPSSNVSGGVSPWTAWSGLVLSGEAHLGLGEEEDEDGGQDGGDPEDVEGGRLGHLAQLPSWWGL